MLKRYSEDMRNRFIEDVFIVDRVFRDITELLKRCSIKTAMSFFCQHGTEEDVSAM